MTEKTITRYLDIDPAASGEFQSEEVAIQLAELWRRLFDDPELPLTPEEDFFVLGASSLLAVTLVDNIQTLFAIDFSLKELLRAPQFLSLANLISSKQAQSKSSSFADGTEENLETGLI